MINTLIKKTINAPRKIRKWFYLFINKLYFKSCGANFGKNFNVYNQVYLYMLDHSKLTIGDNFTFTSGESYNPLCRNIKGCIAINKKAELTIGNNVGISSACIWVHKSIRIGNNVKIGGDTILLDSDCHSLYYMHRRKDDIDHSNKKDKEIIIEDDVLIGTRCIILKGVHIGARSIIGSGSIVTKDIPADCIAAGNPCQIIRLLNT